MHWLKKIWNRSYFTSEDGYKFGSRARIERRAIKEETRTETERTYFCGQYDETSCDLICPGEICRTGERWQCDKCGYDYGGSALAEPDLTEL